MTTVKRKKMVDEDDVDYVDEIEIKIDIKREEGERFEREEEDRRREQRTGFTAVKEERCGLCVKASEEKIVLEERAKRVDGELSEAKAELRETKMEVVALREGRDDDGGEDSLNGSFAWTADEEAALVEGVNEYGLDFDRIKAEAGARLGGRKANALYEHFKRSQPERFRELREATPNKRTDLWTEEVDEVLKRGRLKHGDDREMILETEKEVLGHRTVGALDFKYHKHLS
ncbi:hypothetical protein TrLO_g5679 [Triparma laevis f. longispina]|uniref:Myb-like domain-containing protein n=1 Tax=Triparma laevis f. longispina TaxID=1714387 RepID=A0A9W7F417_9STRA|nr:hypothetical protein TrLO_g5679 [Triparma laevis f. longispina]